MPDTCEGEEIEFARSEAPLVKIGELYGRAISYTRTHGLIEWNDSQRKYQCGWFPANEIRRVCREQWHGQALYF